ncbi:MULTISPECIES: AAA family ATPase [unclassified Fibrobacter]|uniref:AAA family ATPase n=1 Tax=unclassified Fibrobacter TaxID=2634177 RepID=UPI0025BAA0EF|nr:MULTISPECIES: AAA family ATPase [unclassified Fibrobacter]
MLEKEKMIEPLKFRLIKGRFQNASTRPDMDVEFLLEENSSWDDFGYHTGFMLHASKKLTGDKAKALGVIRIMDSDSPQLMNHVAKLVKEIGLENVFLKLPKKYCSVSTTVELYKQLHRILNKEQRKNFEDSFNLILDENNQYYAKVANSSCFNQSLLRGTTINDFALKYGKSKLRDEHCQYDLRSKEIKVKFNDCDEETEFKFTPLMNADNERASEIFPNGVIAFIGNNGSGKSTILYSLALELYKNASNRKMQIKPNDIGISQLMLFSYSYFDDFILPIQEDIHSLTSWQEEVKKYRESHDLLDKPRFIYCGLRNVEKEVEELIKKHVEHENDLRYGEGWYTNDGKVKNRIRETIVKKLNDISEECRNAFVLVLQKSYSSTSDWNVFVQSVSEEFPELGRKIQELHKAALPNDNYKGPSWDLIFKNLSTGYKFFLHMILHLFALVEENALIMFDEPENHLQAPLLSFMMKEIRKFLARRSSVMLVATHSPVVLQEILSSNVRVIRRNGEKISVSKPRIETFGASFDSISSEVFDLTVDKVSYFDVIGEIYKQEYCSTMKSIDDVLALMKDRMGRLSVSAIHYIVQLYYSEKDRGTDVDIA